MSEEIALETTAALVPVAPKNSVALMALVDSVIKNVDFTSLNQAIENIGAHSAALDPEEKQAGVAIVDTWNQDVVRAFQDRSREIIALMRFFDISGGSTDSNYIDTLENIGADLAQRTGTIVELTAYMTAREALRVHGHTRPDKPEVDEDVPKIKALKIQQTYDMELAAYQLQHKRLARRVREAESAWKKLLNEHADVQALLKTMRRQNQGIGALINECASKAQIAKLNIMIGDLNVRQSLREIMAFTSTI